MRKAEGSLTFLAFIIIALAIVAIGLVIVNSLSQNANKAITNVGNGSNEVVSNFVNSLG